MTAKRSDAVQQGPPSAADLGDFPTAHDLPEVWYREHAYRTKPDSGCWWFNAHLPGVEPDGRFDLATPNGTCYLGETEGVAARERCGRFIAYRMTIPVSHVEGRVVSKVILGDKAANIADLTSASAAKYGVTGELTNGNNYTTPAQWAEALHNVGHDAILYQPRFTPGTERALAFLGPEGDRPNWNAPEEVAPLITVLQQLGYRVTRVPSRAEAMSDDSVEPDAR